MCCTTTGKTRVLEIKDPIQFKIGDGGPLTPIAGANEYPNPDIEYDRYMIMRNGAGYLVKNDSYAKLGDGGWKLLGLDVFNPGEVFTMIFF